MGLFGGSSKSSSSTKIDETNVTNVDNRIAEGDKVFQGSTLR